MSNIILDCMGGDNSPYAQVRGGILALKDNADLNLTFVGKSSEIITELNKTKFDKSRVKVLNANDVIYSSDEPVRSIRTKKESSLFIAIHELVNKNYDALISTGNSGAFLAGTLFNVGKLRGIYRPALAPIITIGKKEFIMLDVGANVDCSIDNLVQFSEMGSLYYKMIFNKEDPKVKLLNIGSESNKGNMVVKGTYESLVNHKGINFGGNVEARNIFDGEADVIVCDGFVGNIALKIVEGTSKYILDSSMRQINNNKIYKFIKNLYKPFINKMIGRYDYQKYGGAVFLGINKLCIKSHGSSNEISIKSSIDLATKLIKENFIELLKKNYL